MFLRHFHPVVADRRATAWTTETLSHATSQKNKKMALDSLDLAVGGMSADRFSACFQWFLACGWYFPYVWQHDGISECYWMTIFLVQVSCVSLKTRFWMAFTVKPAALLCCFWAWWHVESMFFLVMFLWDLCETWVFLAAGTWEFPVSGLVYLVWPASQCMSSCIALLSKEVRWSEMEWLVFLVKASRLSVRCEMNGLFYTFIFYRNECGGFHVRRAVVCGWLFTLGTLLFRWGAVLRGPWVAGLFHLLHGSFCCFTALFPNDTVIRLIRCFCFKKVHPCVVKSDAWAIWAKPCLLHLIVFPFLWLHCSFALY